MEPLLLVILGLTGVYAVPVAQLEDTESVVFSVRPEDSMRCGYASCHQPKPDHLNIHIVPHTHDDVGWLKTVDQYYYGTEPWNDGLNSLLQEAFRRSVRTIQLNYTDKDIKKREVVQEIFDKNGQPSKRTRRNLIQKAGVQYIISSVVDELMQDPNRRFIYVETAFFWKWWVKQSVTKQNEVRGLVNEGRLQFVGGAWSMNDEAASHYQSTIDQFTWGLSKLNSTFGYCGLPRVGWQIDPFGHSREFASLLAMMGYDGLFLGRIDYQDKMHRLENKSMEMIWRTSDDLGKSSEIFTGVLRNTYSPPPGFCFDVLCNDEPIIDDPESPMNNVDKKVEAFMDYAREQARHYRTNQVIFTMGGDFTYQDAAMWYINLDKLIKYTNLVSEKNNLKVHAFYSTPNCYLKAIKDRGPILPIKKDDFFPYASDPRAFWTGYFTSRPTTKFFEREANRYLQMVKQLQVLTNLDRHNQFVLNELKSAMGVMQHHDAITGTEKQHVAKDYVRMLNQAVNDAFTIAKQALNKLTQRGEVQKMLDFKLCHLNESSCYISQGSEKFIVTVYNPLGWSIEEPIRIPVWDEGVYSVFAPNGDQITSQIVQIAPPVTKLTGRAYQTTKELVFIAKLQALCYKSYFIMKSNRIRRKADFEYFSNTNDYFDATDSNEIDIIGTSTKATEPPTPEKEIGRRLRKIRRKQSFGEIPKLSVDDMRMMSDQPSPEVTKLENVSELQNKFFRIRYDATQGTISHILFPDNNQLDFSPRMYYYPAAGGKNEGQNDRASGAYIFRPNATQPIPLKVMKSQIIKGPVVSEFRVELHPAGYLSTKVYNDLNFIENEFVVGPIPIDDRIGKEYIVKYETNIINGGNFYTDSNGRQILKRKLDFRPDWNLTLQEPISGNYYPVTNEIFIKNNEFLMAVLTDRSEGGSSIIEGEIELMVHRRLLWDDAFGVGEALNETEQGEGIVVQGKHRVIISKTGEQMARNVLGVHMAPVVTFSEASDMSLSEWLGSNNIYSFLKKPLPIGIHILTLEPWEDGRLLIRLENYLQKGHSSNRTIDLDDIFKNIKVLNIKETMLAANIWANDYKKWMWNNQADQLVESNTRSVIDIKAKEIKTFIVDYEYVDIGY